jgi:alpha-L-rhamnosidase
MDTEIFFGFYGDCIALLRGGCLFGIALCAEEQRLGRNMTITNLKTNHLVNPLGYGIEKPSVSWITENGRAKKQIAARVRVVKGPEPETAAVVFDSGRRNDISSLGYALPVELEPYTRYFWSVAVWCDNGDYAESGWAFFETAKMESPWEARWIRADLDKDTHPYLRKDFELDGEAVWARAYACGLGLYELEINGHKAGSEYLMPGYHAYDRFVQYQTYDILEYLRPGENAAGAMLGPGWYKGRTVWGRGFTNIYGDTMQFIGEIRIRCRDGRELVIGTGTGWLGRASPVEASGIYDGEVYSATKEVPLWSSPGCSAAGWLPVKLTGRTLDDLSARINPPLVRHERFKPRELIVSDKGELILDFGQEITGWVEFDLKDAAPGTEVKLSYSEIMQDGCFYRDNLRAAKAEHVYVSAGGVSTVRPHFTYFGFRYVKIEGLPGLNPDDFSACAVYSGIERTGWIETSNPKINRLVLNTLWSQKDNFLDIPTDCPQRDERMGWTGDVAVFAETANQHLYTPAFFNHYLKNLRKEQEINRGGVPLFVPFPKPDNDRRKMPWSHVEAASVWGDAGAILPWSLFVMYGDTELLRDHYPVIKDWAEYIMARDEEDGGKGLWQTGSHLGDWLALDTDNPQGTDGATDVYYIASAFYYNSVTIAAKAAAVLGYAGDEARYRARAEKIRAAFLKTYFKTDAEPSGGLLAIPETQTALVVALYFELFPQGSAQTLADALVKRIEARGTHLDTGFTGTPLLCLVLSKYGANETAYSLLLQDTYPSWLYEVNMGATTVWERWNSVLPDGRISGTEMNSLNHYAYGSVANWMYRYMCGINPVEEAPGYKSARIAPMPDRRLEKIRMIRDTAAGRYEIAWDWRKDHTVSYRILIPFDCEAVIALPGQDEFTAGPGEFFF